MLEDFLGKKNAMLDRECKWLIEIGVNCVLSDAAFLAWWVRSQGCDH